MPSPSSARCFFCAFTRSVRQNPLSSRKFTTSTPKLTKSKPHRSRGRPAYQSLTAEELGLIQNIKENVAKPLSEREKEDFKQRYTPEQLAAIEAGEAAIDPEDLASQMDFRKDNYALHYIDDLSDVSGFADKPVRAPFENQDPKMRFKTDEELQKEIIEKWFDPSKELDRTDNPVDYLHKMRLTVGKAEAELNSRNVLAPGIPPLRSDRKSAQDINEESEGSRDAETEIMPDELRLMQQTGLTSTEIGKLRVKSIVSHRVVNQTRLGKISSVYVLSVAGNGRGLIGIGEGKSAEFESARLQSEMKAIRNMQPILRYENRTIFGDVTGKVGATELKLYNRPPGFGIRCQQYIFEICQCAGISDLAARVTRSRNPMNTVKATVQALLKQRNPEDVARARGKKLVDVRKVYYAGNV